MPLLELRDVTAFYGPVQVLEGVSLSVPEGGAVGILGSHKTNAASRERGRVSLLVGCSATRVRARRLPGEGGAK